MPRGKNGARAPRRLIRTLRRFRLEIGIALLLVVTFLAVMFENVLLERKITVRPEDTSRIVAFAYADSQQNGKSTVDWDPKHPNSWACHLRAGLDYPVCEYGLIFNALPGTKALDLRNFETFEIDLDYDGPAQQIVFGIKNEDPRYTRTKDGTTVKPNNTALPVGKQGREGKFAFTDFKVPEWWIASQHIPPALADRQVDNIVAIGINPSAELGDHRFTLHSITFHGLWIAKSTYYTVVLALWIAGTIGILLNRLSGLKRTSAVRRRHQTARRRQLALARRTAEEANKAKSDYLANMGHELRTPLNAILGYAQLLERSELEPKDSRAAKVIGDSGRHLLTLINDLLDLAKIEAAKFTLEPRAFDLTETLALVSDITRVRAEEKQIAFHLFAGPGLPQQVIGDDKRLRQILVNLLGNAVKFTAEGEVSLTVSRLGSQEDRARIRFDVADTGPGIAPDELAKLFERFEQVGERNSEGTGLGLSISSQLAHLMGSRIEVESSPGEGSRFWFELELPVALSGGDEVDAAAEADHLPDSDSEDELVFPSPAELQTLLLHARAGNMKEVRKEALRIGSLDPEYAPFAARVERLAASYQSPALLRLVEVHAETQRAA